MNIEKFEEILRWKYDNGVHNFIGNLSGNKYQIQNPSGKVRGYALFVNDKLICCNTRFTNVAWSLWDIESEVAGVSLGEV